MRPMTMITICAGMFALQFAQGQDSTNMDKTARDILNNCAIVEMVDTKILKVFSAEEGGVKYRAYLIKWRNRDVVAGELGNKDLKEGDTVKILVQKIAIPFGPDKIKQTLQFTVFDMNDIIDMNNMGLTTKSK